ncbi:hypothetical protein [Geomicrobium sp. JCM 19039]|uniref:hypothetical protein n=1 Tax=Geomicrobium sp. JCM 19039 TaxID=1460636 RepID=UPI001267FF89|nr:hypothetical protein [Geomicrobium sp. JCM 19039]
MSDTFWKKLRWWVYIGGVGGVVVFIYFADTQAEAMESFFSDRMWLFVVVLIIACILFVLIPLIEIRLSRGVLDWRTIGLTLGVVAALILFFSLTRL